MKSPILNFTVVLFFTGLFSSFTNEKVDNKSVLTTFGAIAKSESLIPIRPGIPGKTPFWNGNAQQFIYAPAFDYKIIDGAKEYLYKIVCEDNTTHNFITKVPYAALSEAWKTMPTGLFKLQVVALNASGDSIGLAGSGEYYKAAYFNGPYHQPVMPYDQSAVLALDQLMKKDYVEYWITHQVPDPKYLNYRYPAKIYSALVIGAITYAQLKPETEDATRSIKLAKIVADYMLDIRFKVGTPWEYFVPTYYGPHAEKAPKEHLKPINSFSIMGVDAGNAFLELYDYSGEVKYLDAAKKIADTYLKRQLDNGSWYQFVNHETGEPTAENIVIPTSVINYFDRLKTQYGVKGLEKATKKTLKWIMDNPVKTFNWQGQFEDVKALPPYKNLSREQACDLAIYLFRNKKDIKLAEELVRFSEDQFVIWEQPKKIAYQEPRPGGRSENWITPSVQEQYVFWMPVGRSAAIMIEAYWEAYAATKKEIYLAKAKSIANAFTLVQKAHNGDYPTFFTQYPMNKWLNSTVYPAKTMMKLEQNIQKLSAIKLIQEPEFKGIIDGKEVRLFTLKNKNGMVTQISNFGGKVLNLWTPDKYGKFDDVVTGFASFEAFKKARGSYFGALIGRYGNRIAQGRFSLDGVSYQLPLNNGENSLHGGPKGFHNVVWEARPFKNKNKEDALELKYVSVDGEMGYPGNLAVTVVYTLTHNNALRIDYSATTDKKTVINLTNHTFFNLHGLSSGEAKSINSHVLQINASKYNPTDEKLIPTGEMAPVAGTPMDFIKPTPIGERVDQDFPDLKHAKGYDHNWILDKGQYEFIEAAVIYEPSNGRLMTVLTTEPGMQFYGGNFFNGKGTGKYGEVYNFRTAFAMETQHFPDSPNQPNFPSTELNPGEAYRHVCIYKFEVKTKFP